MTLVSASGNGSQVEFALPNWSDSHNPEAIAEAIESLVTLYETIQAQLADFSDAQIFVEMLSRIPLNGNRVAYADRSCASLR